MRDELFTDYVEEELLNTALGSGAGLSHSSTYLGLMTGGYDGLEDPKQYHKEPDFDVAGGYARQGSLRWAFEGQTNDYAVYRIDQTVTFGPASSDWPIVLGLVLYDTSQVASGNKLWAYPLDSPLTVNQGEEIQIEEFPIEVILGIANDSLSNLAEKALLDEVLAQGPGYSHTYVEVGLFNNDPGESGSANEVVDSGYSRQTLAGSQWSQPRIRDDGLYKASTQSLKFGPFGSPQSIRYVGLFTPTGDQIASGELSTVLSVPQSQSVTLEPGTLTLSLA